MVAQLNCTVTTLLTAGRHLNYRSGRRINYVARPPVARLDCGV